jgi:hypothetical protein
VGAGAEPQDETDAWDDRLLVRAYEDAVHKYKLHHRHAAAGCTPTRRPLVRGLRRYGRGGEGEHTPCGAVSSTERVKGFGAEAPTQHHAVPPPSRGGGLAGVVWQTHMLPAWCGEPTCCLRGVANPHAACAWAGAVRRHSQDDPSPSPKRAGVALEAATPEADPRILHDWFSLCLRTGRAHAFAPYAGGNALPPSLKATSV